MAEDYVDRTIAAYNEAAEEYASQNADKLRPTEARLDRFVELIPARDVLELGFGLGNDAQRLVNQHQVRYSGIDSTEYYGQRLREILPFSNIKTGDIRKAQLPNRRYGGIWAQASLVFFEERELLLIMRKCHQALISEGVLFTSLITGNGIVTRKNGVTIVLHDEAEVIDVAQQSKFSLIEKTTGLPNPSFPTKRDNWTSYYFKKHENN